MSIPARVAAALAAAFLAALVASPAATLAAGPRPRDADASGRVALPAGEFTPVLPPGPDTRTVRVAAFELYRRPVTNAEFLAFVQAQPAWRRDRVARLYADESYLARWAAPDALGAEVRPAQPVTQVSWYAARAYCSAHAARLQSWYEWEYAAAADETRADARRDPAWRERILGWYARSATGPLPLVGRSAPNYYGVEDLHGLVWEWVEDYAGLMVSGDSREQGDPDKLQFCGAGALAVGSRDDYPVLMRIALLSSLAARDTTTSLGFRCAAGGAQ